MPAPEIAPAWCFVWNRAAFLLRIQPSSLASNIGQSWAASVFPSLLGMYSPCESSHKAYQQRSGRVEPFGQAAHDGTICLRRRKGISPAGTPAPTAGVAEQAGSCARWRTAIRAGVLAQQRGTHTRDSPGHDTVGNGDVSYRPGTATLAR